MEVRIYTLASSRNPMEIKYVGKTIQTVRRRLLGHLCSAKKSKLTGYCTNHNYNWINHELESGYDIVAEELDSMSFSKTEDWSWLEIYWIAQIKAWGFSLVNIKAGGEDNHCSEPSYEVVRKRAEKCIGISRDNKTKIAISKRLTGVKRSEETKEKVRQSIIKKQGRPVLQLDRSGNLIKEWPAGAVAARELGIDKANLNACCKGKRSHVEDIFGNTPWKSLVRLE